MKTKLAEEADVAALAALLWRFAEEDGDPSERRRFTTRLTRWCEANRASHVPFLAFDDTGAAVGMAWLAVLARAPRPRALARACGDVQSVYVVPEHRGTGVGSALVRALLEHAGRLGLEHVTVHANAAAQGLYEQAGFRASPDLMAWRAGTTAIV